MDQENKILSLFKNIPEDEKEYISSSFTKREVKKGTILLKPGDEQKEAGFVILGFFRYFYIDHKGVERTKYFVQENDFLFSLSSFILNSPAVFFIEAISDSTVLFADVNKLKNIIESSVFLKDIYLKQLEKYYIIKEKREAELLLFDARKRYKSFLSDYPDLSEKVKQHYIASYLGMSPETLSRIRKELSLS